MRYTYIILLTLLLTASTDAFGQQGGHEADAHSRPGVKHVSGLTFTVAPLSLVGSHRRMRAGVILHRPRWNYLLDVEYAPGFRGWGDISGQSLHHFFYGLRPELRYALKGNGAAKGTLQPFIGLEVPINYLETVIDGGRYTAASGEYIAFDRGVRHRERVSVLAKYTLAATVARHWYLEGYVGGGAAYRKNYYTRMSNVRPGNEFLEDYEWRFGASPREGAGWVLDLALGVRIGYRL